MPSRRSRLHFFTAASLLAVTLARVDPASAQVDTLDFGPTFLGLPVVASVPIGDIAPIYGAVHAAWRRGPALVHAWKWPDPWQSEIVADSARALDLAVHGDGLPVLAFSDSYGRLICAERSPSGWSLDTVATYPGSTLAISLALDSEPVIAFTELLPSGDGSLRYARRSGGNWTLLQLDDSVSAFWQPSLAIAPEGPAIAYVDLAATTTGQQLTLLEGTGPLGPFTPAVVDTEVLGPVSLAWDTNQGRRRPFVLYFAQEQESFGFIYRLAWRDNAGEWRVERLESESMDNSAYGHVSLALDPVGALGALWLAQSDFEPNGLFESHGPDETNGGCGFINSLNIQISRKPAGVPSSPLETSRVPNVLSNSNTSRFGTGAVSSHLPGTFDVAWREPFINCAPYGIFYRELSSEVTAVPIARQPELAPIVLSPNPVTTGGALRVRWTQPRAAEARLEIHDVAGRVLTSHHAGGLPAGPNEITWRTPTLPPGLYWVALRLDGERSATRVLVSR